MACFVVPAAEAVVTTVAKKKIDKKGSDAAGNRNPFIKKLGWLNNMLWGGSALLAFEHVWHGEIVPYFPFLTNAASPQTAMMMLKEMAVSGVMMAAVVTAVWAGIVAVTHSMEKKLLQTKTVLG
ncbi:MAG: hypothetical protein J1F01_07475 [Oscillospiraceae bacterium]|nr:hypothetical protein [Oscillospiraceae bacterium]